MSADIYHDALVATARAAVGAGRLPDPTGTAMRDNPLCGDTVTFDVRTSGGRVVALAHRVRGCILCQAAASVLGRRAPGRSRAELRRAREQVAALLGAGAPLPDGAMEDLALFEPVGAVKSRHACVLLPFDALDEAMAAGEG